MRLDAITTFSIIQPLIPLHYWIVIVCKVGPEKGGVNFKMHLRISPKENGLRTF